MIPVDFFTNLDLDPQDTAWPTYVDCRPVVGDLVAVSPRLTLKVCYCLFKPDGRLAAELTIQDSWSSMKDFEDWYRRGGSL